MVVAATVHWRAHAALALGAVLAEPLVMFPRRILPSVFDAVFGLYTCRRPLATGGAGGDPDHQTIVNLVSAGLGVRLGTQACASFSDRAWCGRPTCCASRSLDHHAPPAEPTWSGAQLR
jgi:hypothetical protein